MVWNGFIDEQYLHYTEKKSLLKRKYLRPQIPVPFCRKDSCSFTEHINWSTQHQNRWGSFWLGLWGFFGCLFCGFLLLFVLCFVFCFYLGSAVHTGRNSKLWSHYISKPPVAQWCFWGRFCGVNTRLFSRVMKLATTMKMHRRLGAFYFKNHKMLLLQPRVHKTSQKTKSVKPALRETPKSSQADSKDSKHLRTCRKKWVLVLRA